MLRSKRKKPTNKELYRDMGTLFKLVNSIGSNVDSDGGCERWRDPKTDKVYEILWDRVRHTNDAVEVE